MNGDRLRTAMRRVPSSVAVVTAAGPGEIRGMTIGSFTSVSLDPPLISFNVALDAQMHDLVVSAEHFAVHILSDEQVPLSNNFALPDRSGDEQFAAVSYRLVDHGLPVLDEALAVFYCARFAAYPAGDHTLLVGRVLAITDGVAGMPLVYFDRGYRHLGGPIKAG